MEEDAGRVQTAKLT